MAPCTPGPREGRQLLPGAAGSAQRPRRFPPLGRGRSWFGWPDDPKLEALIGEWFKTPNSAGRLQLAAAIQTEVLNDSGHPRGRDGTGEFGPLGVYSQLKLAEIDERLVGIAQVTVKGELAELTIRRANPASLRYRKRTVRLGWGYRIRWRGPVICRMDGSDAPPMLSLARYRSRVTVRDGPKGRRSS